MKSSALSRLYRAIESRPAITALVTTLRAIERVAGRQRAEGILSLLERRFVISGWPFYGFGWMNLHVSRFLWRVRRQWRANGFHAAARQPHRDGSRIRVGLVGRFVALLGFPKELFERCPASIDLHVFDLPYDGRRAEYLRPLASRYVAGDLVPSDLRQMADAIAASDLDLLVNVNAKSDAYDLLDIVSTRCVANYCSGSDVVHHPRVDLQLYWQFQAGYPLREARLWCEHTQLPVGDSLIFQVRGHYDRRGLSLESPRAWADRDPLIVAHGSLFKFAGGDFLQTILPLLRDDGSRQLILMGRDDGSALSVIREAAKRMHVDGQVHYEGAFSSVRNEHGHISDPGWLRLQDLLRRARLAPDPWPLGGGSSRFEAYALGAPSAHMGLSQHERMRASLAVCDLPVLLVPRATAETAAGYADICRRCLDDEGFATVVQQEQREAARRATDPAAWWSDIVAAFEWWERRRVERAA